MREWHSCELPEALTLSFHIDKCTGCLKHEGVHDLLLVLT